MRAVIIDDEHLAVLYLKGLIEKYLPEIEVVGQAENVLTGIQTIKQLNPDLVFLDLELRGGSGFEILEHTNSLSFKKIIVSAYSTEGIKALRSGVDDYLVKPVDELEFLRVVKNVIDKEETRDKGSSQKGLSKIAIPGKNGLDFIDPQLLIRVQGESNYSRFYFANGDKKLISKTLKECEGFLNNSIFFRIHNSHIVNLNHVIKLIRSDGGFVVLSDQSMLPIAKNRREELEEVLVKG